MDATFFTMTTCPLYVSPPSTCLCLLITITITFLFLTKSLKQESLQIQHVDFHQNHPRPARTATAHHLRPPSTAQSGAHRRGVPRLGRPTEDRGVESPKAAD